MKRKLAVWMCACTLAVGLFCGAETSVQASEGEGGRIIDGSELTYDTESMGWAQLLMRGVYLQAGYSKIVRLGPGVIYAGGTTLADCVVDSVQVSVIVERCTEDEPVDTWHYVDSWHKENVNADSAASSRRLEVDGNYYYRVRSIHSANSDVSSSYTDGIFIEEP